MSDTEAKELIPIDWTNVAPPYDHYKFFQGHEGRPFRPRATTFDLHNAWWLIEASSLAYSSPEKVVAELKAVGCRSLSQYAVKDHVPLLYSNHIANNIATTEERVPA